MNERQHISTECAHAGEQPLESGSTPSVMPIYQTTVYDFLDLELVDEVWDHRKPGFIYGRYGLPNHAALEEVAVKLDRKSTRLNSSHVSISYAVFCLKKKK